MSRFASIRTRQVVVALVLASMSLIASVASVLADGGGPPFPH